MYAELLEKSAVYELGGRMVGYVRSRKTTGQWHTRMRQTSRASRFCQSSGSLGWTVGVIQRMAHRDSVGSDRQGPGLCWILSQEETLSEEVCVTADAHARRLHI